MMITVVIFINNKPIISRSAVNMDKEGKLGMHDKNQYRLDIGKIIEHRPIEGCVALAKKMLDTVDKRFEEGI